MATTNYNLPTISDNMSADVVRDHNALAEAVDTELATVEEKVTSHLEQNNVIKHTANEISVVNPETEDTQPLQTFANELFISVSNGKQEIGTAITDVDASVVVPSNPTFTNLADAIGNISTGKKWASGILTSQSAATVFQTYSGANENKSYVQFNFGALDFIPSFIIFTRVNKAVLDYQGLACLWSKTDLINNGSLHYGNVNVPSTANSLYRVYNWVGIVNIPISGPSVDYNWIAFE